MDLAFYRGSLSWFEALSSSEGKLSLYSTAYKDILHAGNTVGGRTKNLSPYIDFSSAVYQYNN